MCEMTTYDATRQQTRDSIFAACASTLVAQKDAVLKLVRGEEVFQAKELLDLLAQVWNQLGYGYKARELYQEIRAEARKELASNESIMDTYRRGYAPYNRLVTENLRLAALIKLC